jgi:6-phosphogluconolactonase
MRMSWLFLLAGVFPMLAADFVYVGTYTTGESKGIYVSRFDAASGKLEPPVLAAETVNPSFVAVHPNKKFLYAVGEAGKAGSVSAFAIDAATGKLTLLNQQPSRGGGPCFVAVDATGRAALVANYNTGSVSALPVKADGSLGEAVGFDQHAGSGPNPKRQAGPHAHSFFLSPDNRFGLAPDLGLDKVFIYRLDPAKAAITPNDPPFASVPPGGGPRHLSFHPSKKALYVINEMGSSITAFSWDAARGAMKQLQTVSTLPADFKGDTTCAHVMVHPSGKFVYGSNRGHDSIAIFAVDKTKLTLKPAGHVSSGGQVPRNFNVHPAGGWLIAANQKSNNLVVFRVDAKTGKLTPTGQEVRVGAPVCVTFR